MEKEKSIEELSTEEMSMEQLREENRRLKRQLQLLRKKYNRFKRKQTDELDDDLRDYELNNEYKVEEPTTTLACPKCNHELELIPCYPKDIYVCNCCLYRRPKD